MDAFFHNFRIVDAESDFLGSLYVSNGLIRAVLPAESADYKKKTETFLKKAASIINGAGNLVLSSGFVDMHAHFREPGASEKEVLESGALAAAAGGWTTVCCMANTSPVIDNLVLWEKIRRRAMELALVDLYPVLSLSRDMEGRELSGIARLDSYKGEAGFPVLLSEDGRDIKDDGFFLKALALAAELDIPVSCHCDLGGEAAAVRRALALGLETGCRLHIAHASLEESVRLIREAKKAGGGKISAEATPHHIALNSRDAEAAGSGSFGKVAPPLAREEDRQSIISALRGGLIDAIATDHAPHTTADKEAGSPGFTGLESAFPVVHDVLCRQNGFSLKDLSRLLSGAPARILKFRDRGAIREGLRADIVLLDAEKRREIPAACFSRGKNSLFTGKTFTGSVLLTMSGGRIVYCA